MNDQFINQIKSNPMLAYSVVPAVAKQTGYKMKTTYFGDFLVCLESTKDILETFGRAFEFAKNDMVYGTELAMVLNWLTWDFADYNNEVAHLYNKLWKELDQWIMENWKGAELRYYTRETD